MAPGGNTFVVVGSMSIDGDTVMLCAEGSSVDDEENADDAERA